MAGHSHDFAGVPRAERLRDLWQSRTSWVHGKRNDRVSNLMATVEELLEHLGSLDVTRPTPAKSFLVSELGFLVLDHLQTEPSVATLSHVETESLFRFIVYCINRKVDADLGELHLAKLAQGKALQSLKAAKAAH